jgi:hypothetical protein
MFLITKNRQIVNLSTTLSTDDYNPLSYTIFTGGDSWDLLVVGLGMGLKGEVHPRTGHEGPEGE